MFIKLQICMYDMCILSSTNVTREKVILVAGEQAHLSASTNFLYFVNIIGMFSC